MKEIQDKYNKDDIPKLPRELFSGRIFVIFTKEDCQKAVRYLMTRDILGLDTETRPNFKKGQMRSVALLQVATHDTCFLFRLNRTDLTEPLIKLLEDTSITKVGLSLQDDLRQLRQRKDFKPGKFVELQSKVKDLGIQDMSLQKIYANLFGKRIAKAQQLSNWEAEALTEPQQRYAATDAWACIKIYEELERLKRDKDYVLLKNIDEQDEEHILEEG